MRRTALPVFLMTLAAAPAGAAAFDPATAATALMPFVDQQTVAIVRADVRPADADAAVQLVARFVHPTEAELAQVKETAKTLAAGLAKAGTSQLFLVVSLDDLPAVPPFIVVPLPANADDDSLRAALKAIYRGEAVRYGNAVVVAAPSTHERLKAAKPSPRPEIAAAFAAASADAAIQAVLVPSADHRKVAAELMPKLPAQLGPDAPKTIARGITWAALSLDVRPKFAARLTVKSEDADAAKALAALVETVLQQAGQTREAKELLGLAKLLAQLNPKAEGDRVVMAVDEDSRPLLELIAASAVKARQAAARSQSMNNLKQIALAWHNYHDAKKAFPYAASKSADGKPLLSWRVHILPYLEQGELYKQFNLHEPWDGPTNKPLIAKMPAVYASAAQKVGGGKTTYLAPWGQGGPMGGVLVGMAGVRFAEISDGTSNTIMVVEAGDGAAVPWTKPDDIEVTETDPLKGLLGHYPDVFNVAFGDGSVRAIRATVEPKTLWALFTRNGGEVISGGF